MLKSWGFDPDAYEVLNDTVRVATWEVSAKDDNHQIITKQLWSHRAHIRLKSQDRADVGSLIAEIRKRRPRKGVQSRSDDPVTFVVAPSDLQCGKGEGGGSPALVQRVIEVFEQTSYRLDGLRKRYNVEAALVLLPGDNVERCDGQYSNQLFTTDLNERDQFKVARRLIESGIDQWSGMVPRLTCAAVASNHGENRLNGKKAPTMRTTPTWRWPRRWPTSTPRTRSGTGTSAS